MVDYAAIPVGTPTFADSNNVIGTTITVPRPTDMPGGIKNGDIVVVFIRCGSSTSAVDYTSPGFTRQGIAFVPASAGGRVSGFFTHFVTDATSEPSSYVFTLAGNTFNRQSAMVQVFRNDPLAQPYTVEPIYGLSPSAGLTVVPDFTVPANSRVIYYGGNELVSPNTITPTYPATLIGTHGSLTNQSDTTGTRSVLVASHEVLTGLVTGKQIIWPAASGALAYAISIPPTPAIPPASGTPVKIGDGRAAGLTYISPALVRTTPTAVRTWYGGYADVTAMLADTAQTPTAAHRGGSAIWPEFSEYAYDHSVTEGYSMLEMSCASSSDLVLFGNGDQYLDNMTEATGSVDASTLTWATINSTYQNRFRPVSPGVYQPLLTLEKFLRKYTPTHICIVDLKYKFNSVPHVNEAIRLANLYGGPSKVMFKFDSPTSDVTMTSRVRPLGYKAINYWGTNANLAAMDAQQVNWDIIGYRYDDATMKNQAKTYGKKTWAAVIPDQAGYNTAKADGAAFAMITNPVAVLPSSVWN